MSRKFLNLSARRAAGTSGSFGSRLVGLLRGGVTAVGDISAAFLSFLTVPADAVLQVALKLAGAAGQTGIRGLSPEQRKQLAVQIDQDALDGAEDVAAAAARVPEIEAQTGTPAAGVRKHIQQQEELGGLRRVLGMGQRNVDGVRRLLQSWQYEAERALTQQLFKELLDPNADPLDKMQLVGDAADALDILEGDIGQRKEVRLKGARTQQELQAALDKAEKDALLLQTMRDIREHKIPDERTMQEMALYLDEWLQETDLRQHAR